MNQFKSVGNVESGRRVNLDARFITAGALAKVRREKELENGKPSSDMWPTLSPRAQMATTARPVKPRAKTETTWSVSVLSSKLQEAQLQMDSASKRSLAKAVTVPLLSLSGFVSVTLGTITALSGGTLPDVLGFAALGVFVIPTYIVAKITKNMWQ